MKNAKRRIILSGILALGFNAQASAEAWQWTPSLTLRSGYDDNIRLKGDVENETENDAAIETSLKAKGELARLGELSETRFYLQGGYLNYSAEDDKTLEDSESLVLGVDYGYKYTERQGIQLLAEYTLDIVGDSSRLDNTDDVDNNTVSTQIDRERALAQLEWALDLTERSFINLAYKFEDVSFDDKDNSTFLTDYQYQDLNANYQFHWSDKVTVGVKVARIQYESDSLVEVDSDQLSVEYAFSLTEVSRFWLNVGFHDTDANILVNSSSKSGVLFDMNYEKKGDKNSFSAKVGRKLSPSGNGELLETDSISVNVNTPLSERYSFSLYGSILRTTKLFDRAEEKYERDFVFVMPQLLYKLSEKWNVGVNYRYRWTDDDSKLKSVDSNGVFLSVNYTPFSGPR